MAWPVLGAIGGALIGGLFQREGQRDANATNMMLAERNSEFNAEQAALNRDFSAAQAQKQMEFQLFAGDRYAQRQEDFQRNMAGSSYQRAIADMQAAGLNPMLAYSQGGAATPAGSAQHAGGAAGGGSAAQAVPARVENELGGFTQSAVGLAGHIAAIEKVQAETEEVKARTATERERPENVRGHTGLMVDQQRRIDAEIDRMAYQNDLTAAQKRLVEQEVKKVFQETDIRTSEAFLHRLEMLVREQTASKDINEAVAEAKAWLERGEARTWIRDVGGGASAGAASALILDRVMRGLRGAPRGVPPGGLPRLGRERSSGSIDRAPWLNDRPTSRSSRFVPGHGWTD